MARRLYRLNLSGCRYRKLDRYFSTSSYGNRGKRSI